MGFRVTSNGRSRKGKFYIVQSRPITTACGRQERERRIIEIRPNIQGVSSSALALFLGREAVSKYYQVLSGTDVGLLYKDVDNELTGYMQVDAKDVIYESLAGRPAKSFLTVFLPCTKKTVCRAFLP